MALSVVVPTLGHSSQLADCLEALRQAAEACRDEVEIILVVPEGLDPSQIPCLQRNPAPLSAVGRIVTVDRPGFSAAVNTGFEASDSDLLATVNDDAVVDPAWLEELVGALADQRLGAVQGVHRRFDAPGKLDGYGIGWNRWCQAVQLGHGRPLGEAPGEPVEIFGVSATAAVYRRQALLDARSPSVVGSFFDEALFAYYEDVDLAARLHAAGSMALCRPSAGAVHVGSVSGRRLPFGGRRLIHGNRHLILARLLGRSFWRRWPRIAARDLIDGSRALIAGDLSGAVGIAAGQLRALRRLPRFAHLGEAYVDLRHWTESGQSAYYGSLRHAQSPDDDTSSWTPLP